MSPLSGSAGLFVALCAAIGLERLVELALSRRHAARAFARGGIEVGRGHLGAMVAMHATFLVAAPLEVVLLRRPLLPLLAVPSLAVVAMAMALRYWCILTLRERWNTRVIVVPGEEAVVAGPYRWLRHPNYLAVIAEIAALPLVHTAWITSVVWSALNACVLSVRIRVEEEALTRHAAYGARLGAMPRLLPGAPAAGAATPGAPR